MEIIGGHRLVRRLGGGRRAEVFLAHPVRPDASGARPAVAVKRYRPTTPLESIDREIQALARVCSPQPGPAHLQRLDDLSRSDDDRPALILRRLEGPTLAEVLVERSALEPGEFVTVAAPITEAVGALHRVGVAHGGLRLGAVRFDDRGAPVLVGFGGSEIVGPLPAGPDASSLTPAEAERCAPVLRDLVDLIALVTTLAAAVTPSPQRDALLEHLEHIAPRESAHLVCAELVDLVFAFAMPCPVDLAPAPAHHTTASPFSTLSFPAGASPTPAFSRPDFSRPDISRPDVPASPAPRESRVRRAAASDASWFSLGAPSWLDPVREGVRHAMVGALGRLRSALAPVRRPVWIAAATIGVLLIVAIVVVPPNGGASADGASADDAPPHTGASEPADPPSAPDIDDVSEKYIAAVTGDDPMLAAGALLEWRSLCFEALSRACLDEVDQRGSAAADADGWIIRRAQEENQPIEVDEFGPLVLGESMGDSALVVSTLVAPASAVGSDEQTLDEEAPDDEAPDDQAPAYRTAASAVGAPVTILLMRTEGRWALRDVIVG